MPLFLTNILVTLKHHNLSRIQKGWFHQTHGYILCGLDKTKCKISVTDPMHFGIGQGHDAGFFIFFIIE